MDFPPAFPEPSSSDLSPPLSDTITSLINMADKMEALLPPELDLSAHLSDTISTVTLPSIPPPVPKPEPLAKREPHLEPLAKPEPLPYPVYAPTLSLDACSSPPQPSCAPAPPPTASPVAPRDLDLSVCVSRAAISKPWRPASYAPRPAKTPRKPKTYSKPVASRFCHICSRMPRRGQGSLACRRMAEGFCRKIVCEQCLREQGWDYEAAAANPAAWLCPHCADNCPPRSQCHIYNRINARRKRAGKGGGAQQAAAKQQPSVAAALASSDVLLGPYGHLLGVGGVQRKVVSEQILQPPPNFRLNLPPQYSQQ